VSCQRALTRSDLVEGEPFDAGKMDGSGIMGPFGLLAFFDWELMCDDAEMKKNMWYCGPTFQFEFYRVPSKDCQKVKIFAEVDHGPEG